MKYQLLSLIKAQILLLLIVLFITHRLLSELIGTEDGVGKGPQKYPGIDFKEF